MLVAGELDYKVGSLLQVSAFCRKKLSLSRYPKGNLTFKVEVPKFQLEGEFELSNALYRMGLKDAFTSRANFSGISRSTLFISKVVHKSLIKVTTSTACIDHIFATLKFELPG